MSFALTDLIKEQGYQCLILFGAGVAFMIVWQLCSLAVNTLKIQKWMRIPLEIVFWIITTFMVSEFLYYGTYGSFAIHTIVAFAAGVFLWKKCFYGIISQYQEKRMQGEGESHGEEKQKPPV